MSNPNPNVVCAPCQKEIICSRKARALIDTGHSFMMLAQMTDEKLTAWNELLDTFIVKAEEVLA